MVAGEMNSFYLLRAQRSEFSQGPPKIAWIYLNAKNDGFGIALAAALPFVF
jgi:hypothetical protein